MKEKLLSIVIANYNYGRFLEEAILSVVTQDGFDECELIICDAASVDNSVEIIKKYADKLVWWCSEKDDGQSAAFNKGFSHSTGKYLTWLNADDILVPGCLKKILAEMKKHSDCEWFTGNFFRFVQDTGKICEIGWGPNFYPKVLQRRNSPIVVFGPTAFFSRQIYEQAGKIDERLHFSMDTDLWLRFMAAGIKQRRIRCFCWAFRMHEASKTAEFGDHRVSDAAFKAGKIEHQIMFDKTGYCRSVPLWWALRLWRILDGSILALFWMRFAWIGRDHHELKI